MPCKSKRQRLSAAVMGVAVVAGRMLRSRRLRPLKRMRQRRWRGWLAGKGPVTRVSPPAVGTSSASRSRSSRAVVAAGQRSSKRRSSKVTMPAADQSRRNTWLPLRSTQTATGPEPIGVPTTAGRPSLQAAPLRATRNGSSIISRGDGPGLRISHSACPIRSLPSSTAVRRKSDRYGRRRASSSICRAARSCCSNSSRDIRRIGPKSNCLSTAGSCSGVTRKRRKGIGSSDRGVSRKGASGN